MKALLLHHDRDADLARELPVSAEALTQDLELDTLLTTMAAGDPFLLEVSRRVLLSSLIDPHAILYRQQILTDCGSNPSVVRDLYVLAGDALQAEKTVWGSFYRDAPRSRLATSVKKMELLVGFLRRLTAYAAEHAAAFHSPGFTRFFSTLAEELNQDYFELVEHNLKELQFKAGVLMSAQLATGNKGTAYMLRRPRMQRLLGRMFDRSGYGFTVPDRDQSGFRALGELEDRGVNLVANALTQSLDDVLGFLIALRTEIGFYVACLNLRDRLAEKGEPVAFPVALHVSEVGLSAEGLYDVGLALTLQERTVGNDIDADHKSLVMITGANQGGKSTFLRGVGLAQLMTQAGMFVGARSFRTNVCDGLYTHFNREEDQAMESGKLDEELARMSAIADAIGPHSMLLCNESFAATNEREGSEIARQVIQALLSAQIKVVFVTHLFELADSVYGQQSDTALFMRAQRGSDGARPFKLAEGRPLPTSYGEDAYEKVFGKTVEAASDTRRR